MEIEFYPPVLQTVLNTGDRIYFVRDEKDRTNKAMQNLQDRYDNEDKEEDNKRRNVRVMHNSTRTIPCRKTVITDEHPYCGKSVGPEGVNLGNPLGLNIQLLAIDTRPNRWQASERITSPGKDTRLSQGHTAYYGCCYCQGAIDVNDELCNCNAMDPEAESTSLPMEFFVVPPSLNKSCFGRVLLPGAVRCLDLSYLEGVRIVAICKKRTKEEEEEEGVSLSDGDSQQGHEGDKEEGHEGDEEEEQPESDEGDEVKSLKTMKVMHEKKAARRP